MGAFLNDVRADYEAGVVSSEAMGPEFFLLLVLAVPYFVPSIVAVARKMPNKGSTIVVNVFLGWTFIGWVVALAMACGRKESPVKTGTMTSQ
ncbi:MAG: superinfection immunity protein [Myxococcales bacterium]|nr:superinfection immunity protein [Myxococcales bacterium]